LAAGLVALCLVCGGLGALAMRLLSPVSEASDVPDITVTAPVQKGVLTQDVITRGVVAYEGSYTVKGMSGVVTDAGLGVGAEVAEGAKVAEVSDRPVIVFQGAVPMYRDMYQGDSGRDVQQLNDALVRIGALAESRAGRSFTSYTAAALKGYYAYLGYSGTNARDYATTTEIVFVPALPAVVTSVPPALGEAVSEKLLDLGSGTLTARISLSLGQKSLVEPGQTVTVGSDSGGEQVAGEVVSVGEQPTSVDGGVAVYAAMASLDAEGVALLGQDVRVQIATAATAGEVLYVPLAAVVTTADQKTWLDVWNNGDTVATRLEVRLGLAVSGNVEVVPVGGSLAAGDRVIVDGPR
jgi:hypothetical protein